jgi:hypothetical protein
MAVTKTCEQIRQYVPGVEPDWVAKNLEYINPSALLSVLACKS